jgi:hypothetical protein
VGHLLTTDQRSWLWLRSFDGNNDGTAYCEIDAHEIQLTQHVFLPLVKR